MEAAGSKPITDALLPVMPVRVGVADTARLESSSFSLDDRFYSMFPFNDLMNDVAGALHLSCPA